MRNLLILLSILSVIIISVVSFEDVFAEKSEHIPHVKPTFIFEERDYNQSETITATCINNDHRNVRNYQWIISDITKGIPSNHTNTKSKLTVFSISASDFSPGNYMIKCSVILSDTHKTSVGSFFFSIIAVPPDSPPDSIDIINDVDMSYDGITKDLTISWDFGENLYRDSCNSKTEFYQDNYLSLTPLRYDPDGEYLNFEGYNKNTFGDGSLSLRNTDLTNSIIDCKGEIIFNIETQHPSDFTDEFSLYMTFFEVINLDDRDEPQYDSIRSDGIIPLNAAQFVTTMKGDIESAKCGELDPKYDQWRFVELIYDITGATKTVYESLDGCYSDNPSSLPYSIKEIADTSQTKKKNSGGGGNCSGDCTSPTIGLDKNGVRFVDNGLKLNGVSFDGDYFKTHMPMQYTEIGKINHLSLKVYENSGIYNIDMIQFGIVKEIGSPINLAEPRIEIDVSNFANDVENASLDNITLIDKEGIISHHDVSVSIVSCMDQSSQECLQLDIYWTFAKIPEFNVLVINGWDNNKNSFNNYFNDGLTTIDPNYVEPETIQPYRYECKDPKLEDIQVWTMFNCNFNSKIIAEQDKATLIFDSTKLISKLSDSWSYDSPKSDTEKQLELDRKISIEIDRSLKILENMK